MCSLASLIRGQVVTSDGTPLVGVNVSFVNYPHYGYTMTRQDGMSVSKQTVLSIHINTVFCFTQYIMGMMGSVDEGS